ncbi:restriction endonuclease [Pareuzebyella sediminis]|uniref:restriction endonuclease n=1 Tax=Pareuzebyella sediminis TaxID=2607998 RepID=UPI0011EFF55C|nr:hypothetical protein [Pareuzebyella sediminis]
MTEQIVKRIKAKKVIFIKLGPGGEYEADCIEKSQTLRLGYKNVDHDLCLNGKWNLVHEYFREEENATQGVATSHTNQLKQFYEDDEKTLWLTFFKNKLWWSFSRAEIKLLPDKTKTRPVIGNWSDKNINGELLLAGNLSGKLLRTQGFRGTICKVPEEKYAIQKINNEQLKEVIELENAITKLKEKLGILIKSLQWKDFETLIDLIFRQAGWQRVSETGKTQKTLDLELLAPVTGERAIVQIKSQSDLKQFLHYQNKFATMTDYDKFFYVVHSAKKSLSEYKNETDTMLYFGDKITDLTINSGLLDWVIKRTS